MPAAPKPSAAADTVLRQSRSASAAVAKHAKGFGVFRSDGYSLVETLPGGECVSFRTFTVGGRHRWRVELYPTARTAPRTRPPPSRSSSGLRMRTRRCSSSSKKKRVQAKYKFSLLDAATGRDAYELPAKTGIFRLPSLGSRVEQEPDEGLRCGYAEFVSKEKLKRRRASLVRDDCMAVRCDVCVTVVKTVSIGVKHGRRSGNNDSSGSSSSDCSINSDNSDDSSNGSSGCNCNPYYCHRSDSDDDSRDDSSEGRGDSSDSSRSNSHSDFFGNIASDDSSDDSDDGGSDDDSDHSDDGSDDSSGCNDDDDDDGSDSSGDDSSDSSDDSSGNRYGNSYSDFFGNDIVSSDDGSDSTDGSDFPDDSSSNGRDGRDSSDSSDDPSDSSSDSGVETRHRNKRHRPDLSDTDHVQH